jgi:hypothetical protein
MPEESHESTITTQEFTDYFGGFKGIVSRIDGQEGVIGILIDLYSGETVRRIHGFTMKKVLDTLQENANKLTISGVLAVL